MNFKKLLIRINLIIVLSLTFIFVSHPSLKKATTKVSATETPTLTVSAANIENGMFIPDKTGNIYITLSLSSVTDHDVYIYIHATDATAVSVAGDYFYTGGSATSSSTLDEKASATHNQTKLKIVKGSKSTAINYLTSDSPIVTMHDGSVIRNYFYFVVSEVTGASLSTSKYKCGLGYDRCLNITSSGGYNYFEDYNLEGNIEKSVTNDYSTSGNLFSDKNGLNRSVVMDNLLDTGLASIYTQMKCWGEAGFPNINDYDFDLYAVSSTKNYIAGWSECFFVDRNSVASVKNGRSYLGDNYIKLNADERDNYYIKVENFAGIKRWGKYRLLSRFVDTKKANITGYYIDSSSSTLDGYVYLSLRFSEPIQVTGDASSLELFGYENTGSKTVKFTYVEGNYTDTLVFACDLSYIQSICKDSQIKSMTFTKLSNISLLGDLGKNFDGKPNFYSDSDKSSYVGGSNKVCEAKAKCNIDLRVPTLSVPTKYNADIVRERNVELTVSRMASGRVYYSWVSASEVPQNISDVVYTNFIDIDVDSKSDHKVIIPGSGLTGEYYLYIKVDSSSGISKAERYGRLSSSKEVIGGYLFDNIAPSINNPEFFIDSLTDKVFKIEGYDGTNIFDSGIGEINIHYSKNKDFAHASSSCIYSSDGSINALSISPTGYVLGAKAYTLQYSTVLTRVSKNEFVFGSLEAAIEYLTLYEYTDFRIYHYSEISDKSKIVSGEEYTEDSYFIRYKASDFDYDKYFSGSVIYQNDVMQSGVNPASDYVYYVYGGSDKTVIDYSLLSDNLIDVCKSIATKIASYGSVISDMAYSGYISSEDSYKTIKKGNANFKVETEIIYPGGVVKFKNGTSSGLYYVDKSLVMSADGGSVLYRLQASDSIIGLGDKEYSYYYIWFSISDGAGNTYTTFDHKLYTKYDTRTLFKSTDSVKQSETDAVSVDKIVESYDLNNGPIKVVFQSDLEPGEEGGNICIERIVYGKEEFITSQEQPLDSTFQSSLFSISAVSSLGNGNTQITLSLYKPGYLSVDLALDDGKFAEEPYTYYITQGFSEETTNYASSSGATVLVNTVFQLNSDYYYMNSNNSVVDVSYGDVFKSLYPTTKVPDLRATFSSKSAATEYVRYMEYQDMTLLVLNSTVAQALENGTANKEYVKADGCTSDEAKVGQTWIRYKRSTWTVNTTEYDWVYYFYSDNACSSISISELKEPLKNAIADVVSYIISKGSEVYLVGSTYADSNGAPYLEKSQKHYEKETVATSKCGSSFIPSLIYSGDSDIYSSSIIDRTDGYDEEIPIVSNTVLIEATSNIISYAYYNGSTPIKDLDFTIIDDVSLKTYKDAISGGTGVYIIREFGLEGIRQYKVYLDKTAPVLKVTYTSAKDDKQTVTSFTKDDQGVYATKRFTIGAIDLGYEKDMLSYVAIYDASAHNKFLAVYFAEYLSNNTVELENGEYTILVSDRTGNSYQFTVYVNDEPLNVIVSTVDGDYVTVSINRTAFQIYRYEVYLNNGAVPIDKTWEDNAKKKYRESGCYRIYVEDIYGFSKEIGGDSSYQYQRDLPNITWSYYGDDNNYHKYEEGVTKCMKITKSLGSNIFIQTSRELRFTMNGDYAYSFEGIDSKSITLSYNNKVVSINTSQDFTMTIWYRNYPDIKATYICTVDSVAPEIDLSYESTSFMLNEYELAQSFAAMSKAGDIYLPTNIGYNASRTMTNNIMDGDIVDSNLIKLKVSDRSGVETLLIYIDGELVSKANVVDGQVSTIPLSRYGKYKIVATDIFGNSRTVEFSNAYHNFAEASIDGAVCEARTTNTLYGNSNVTLKLLENSYVALKVIRDNKTYVYFFHVEDGDVKPCDYVCCESTNNPGSLSCELTNRTTKSINSFGEIIYEDIVVFSRRSLSYKANKWTQVLYEYDQDSKIKDGFDLYMMFDKDGNMYMKVECTKTKLAIDLRASFDDESEPHFYKAVLSKEVTEISFISSDDYTIETPEVGIAYANKTFKISDLLSSDITQIYFSSSSSITFDNYRLIYPYVHIVDFEEVVGIADFDTLSNDFYSFKVVNIYGNTKEYIINKSDFFKVQTKAIYDDSLEQLFTYEYSGVTNANKKAIVEAFALSATFTVLKDNVPYQASVYDASSYFYISLTQEGEYIVSVVDNYGNEVVKQISIKNTNLEYDNSFLTGFNSLALRLSEGYTNKILSVDPAAISIKDVKYVSYIYNGSEHILYNDLTENPITLNPQTLASCIGLDGDGLYEVIFRDSYGSLARKEIHYKKDTTISVSRKIKSSTEYEEFSIDDVCLNGIWCNSLIKISSSANEFKLYLNGSQESSVLPLELSLAFATGSASISHSIVYVDEYGFKHEFMCYLDRKDLLITLDPSIETKTIQNIETTRSNISLTFTEGTCTYTLNGVDAGSYTSGQVLKRDGIYRFTLKDKSGNITYYSVKRDTYCDFSFIDSATKNVLFNNQIVIDGPVTFESNNSDNVEIIGLYLDGVEIIDIPRTFREHGKYAVVLQDPIGNMSLFEFYLITHEICELNYNTPNTYIITDVWYSSWDGNFVSIINDGVVTHSNRGNYSNITVTENGVYQVSMTSEIYESGLTFTFTIDNTAPEVSLIGCAEGEKTIENVSVSGVEVGDTIYVYKDGKLVSETQITTSASDAPVIKEGGKYKIAVKNRAGVVTTLEFERKYIPNGAGSALIIILCVAAAIGILIGVVLRNKQKFDE